tara:strand:+ start:1467 stop:1592 length:126 start_codon:yes stop_codon:yes gene_type:complete
MFKKAWLIEDEEGDVSVVFELPYLLGYNTVKEIVYAEVIME